MSSDLDLLHQILDSSPITENNKVEIMSDLSDQENAKRRSLESVSKEREGVVIRSMDLQDRVLGAHIRAKKSERILSSQAGQLLKALKTEEARISKLSGCVHRIQKSRKQLLGNIREPSWAIPHHYHMTAVEHALGHAQPHVMDVGTMIRGHLRLYAMAQCTVRFQKNASHVLSKAKSGRAKVSDQIKTVYRQLRVTRAELKDLEKLLENLKNKIGPPQKRTQKQIEAVKRLQTHRLNNSSGGSGENNNKNSISSNVFEDTNRLLRLEMKSNVENELELKSSTQTNPDSPTSSTGSSPPRPHSILVDTAFVQDIERSPSSPQNIPSKKNDHDKKTKRGVAIGSPRLQPQVGYRNIKLRFFQALNLTPPALGAASTSPSTAPTPNSSSLNTTSDGLNISSPTTTTTKQSSSSSSLSSPKETTLEEPNALLWKEFSNLLRELVPLDNAKQCAWEELENVLDRRERFKVHFNNDNNNNNNNSSTKKDEDEEHDQKTNED